MTQLSDKIKTALDESRILILGTQLLLGFQYRAFFESGFEALPKTSQYIEIIGLGLLLLAIALIMWPSAYHRVVWNGNDAKDVHQFATRIMDVALLPFAIALALDFYVLAGKVWGVQGGVLMSAAIAAAALMLWYGFAFLDRRRERRSPSGRTRARDSRKTDEETQMETTPP